MKPTYYALDRNIIAVATNLPYGGWGAYIGVVAGRDHSQELKGVLQTGTKVRERVARAMFPEFDGQPYGFYNQD
jgi:hypothetical protein